MKKGLIFVILMALLMTGTYAQDESGTVKKLTLKDAIFLALKNNLDLQVQKTVVENSRLSWKISKTIYLPTLTVDTTYAKSRQPSNSVYDGVSIVEGNQTQTRFGLSQLTPYGGTLSFNLNMIRNETNQLNVNYNPYFSTSGYVTFIQPVLRNFGNLPTNYTIRISGNNNKISQLQLEENVVGLVYNVETAYWELVYAHQYLEARKMALQRSQDLLAQNQIKVKVGTIAPIEVLSSKAEVAANESAVIQAERYIQTQEDNLKRILNMSRDPQSIIPTDLPEIVSLDVEFEKCILEALEKRPDMKIARLNLENQDITVKYQRNQALPQLNIVATFYSRGAAGTLWDFPPFINPSNPDYYRVQVGTPGKLSDALGELFKLKNNDYSISANLTISIPMTRERAQLAQSKVLLKQSFLQLKNVENTVYSEVKGITKELETSRKLVDADKIAVELAGENLKAEEKRLSVGLVTNFNVLEYQRRYADAQTQALRSSVDYTLAIARLNRILNRTFNVYEINFAEISKSE